MWTHTTDPIISLPTNYQQAHYLRLTERWRMVWLNLFSLVPLFVSAPLVFGILLVYHEELGGGLVINALPERVPSSLGLLLALLALPLHEYAHGLAIQWFGHKPRYGVKWMVLFATSDGGLFRRNEFILIALAPLALISAAGLFLMPFLPMGIGQWVALAVVMNAAGAIGDLWMIVVALRFDSSALIKDEEDGMRIFARAAA